MKAVAVCVALGLCVLSVGAVAQTADDVVALAQKDVAPEVLMAFVETADNAFNLSSEDIIKLKDAKVPDKVVVAMLKHQPSAPVVAIRRSAPRSQDQNGNGNWNDYPVQPQQQERVVVRERVVEQPSTTVVYRDAPSVVYADYSPYYYPYSSYYPSYISLGFGDYCGSRYYGGYNSYRGGYYGGHSYGTHVNLGFSNYSHGGRTGYTTGFNTGYRSGSLGGTGYRGGSFGGSTGYRGGRR
ncbi:MAG TPA: hypothetical protein VGP72_11635 [Planctomycetota bacterium]|jgi:hypothetical protein